MQTSAGKRFRDALAAEQPLQIVGTVNAYTAMQARDVGFQAIYLSGGALAGVSYGLPDLGITTLDDVLADAKRITDVVDTPLLVDIDTGFGTALNIERTIKQMIKVGVAAVHIEDQVAAKRCGHRPNKQVVPTEEMQDRIRVAVGAKTDPDFYIIARTDAIAKEGLQAGIERAHAYVEAGADAIFAEALTSAEDYQQFCQAVSVPVLANMTEFGKSPLMTRQALKACGVQMILYPLTITRAMNQIAMDSLTALRLHGDQKSFVDKMQTREKLYEVLGYHQVEERVDKLLS